MTDIEQAIEKELGFRIDEGTVLGAHCQKVLFSNGQSYYANTTEWKLWQSLISARRENEKLKAEYNDLLVRRAGDWDWAQNKIADLKRQSESRPESEVVKALLDEKDMGTLIQAAAIKRYGTQPQNVSERFGFYNGSQWAFDWLRARIAQLKGTER